MSDDRTISYLVWKLIDNPILTLLFFQESVKVLIENGLTNLFWTYLALSVGSAILWALSDTVDIDISKTDSGFFR